MNCCDRKLRLALHAVVVLWLISAAAGQVTTLQFTSGVGTPAGSVVLSGSAISPSTGRPYRHLWTADPVNGLCRMDPDLDTQSAHAVNPATCVTTIQGVALNPGAMTFDATLNDLYVLDAGGKLGVFRLHFLPSADSGFGLLSTTQQEVLGGSITGGKLVGGCNIQLNAPQALALGPDENLYVGFSRTGSLMRIVAPQTEPLPCTNVQANVASTPDARRDSALAWVGHTLFGVDNTTTFAIANADQCLTPQNGNNACPPLAGGNFLFLAGATAMASDQAFPNLGTKVYIATSTQLFLFDTSPSAGSVRLYASSTFANISALGVDIPSTGSEVVYVGDDPSAGLVAGQGRWWEVTSAPPPPGPPAAPTNVVAVAGNAQVTLSWSPTPNGQPTTSYTVRNTSVSAGVPIPDVVVTALSGSSAPPTSVSISGLTNGTTYQFAVKASNAQGSSAFSAPGNPVTPSAPTVPAAPSAISASAGDAFANVAWTVPSNGGSPITSYTVTALVNGAPIGITSTVAAPITNTNITGLTDGTTYTFTVHATNALGSGPESLPSIPVTPQAITVPGAPTAVTAIAGNAQATVSWTAPANTGGALITLYTVSAQIAGVTVSSIQVFSGATSTVFGGLSNGTAYTFVVSATNQAGTGAASLPSNAVTPAPPPTTTDIQVVGSAQNGGPSSTSPDTFTWQIKDNQNVVANGVNFTSSLPAGMVFGSVSSTLGSCIGPAPGTAGGKVSCSLASLSGGQTMLVTVNVTFNTTGTMTTTGSANFTGTDTNPANNSFSVTIGVK